MGHPANGGCLPHASTAGATGLWVEGDRQGDNCLGRKSLGLFTREGGTQGPGKPQVGQEAGGQRELEQAGLL